MNFCEVVRELEESGLRLGTSELRVPALWQLCSCPILLSRLSDFSCAVQAGGRGAVGCLSAMVPLTVTAFRLPSSFCEGKYSQGLPDASAFVANECIPTDNIFLSSRFSSRDCIGAYARIRNFVELTVTTAGRIHPVSITQSCFPGEGLFLGRQDWRWLLGIDGHDSTGGAGAVDESKGTTFTRIAAVTFPQEDNRGT